MRKKRWVGLRSASFRRTLLVAGIILLFVLGFWIGNKRQTPASKQIELLEQQVKTLEMQVDQLKGFTKKLQ